MPAQLTVTSGVGARRLRWCTSRAITSLPTPLSPVISTLASDRAAYSISASTARIAAPMPTMDSPPLFTIDTFQQPWSNPPRVVALGVGDPVAGDRRPHQLSGI